MAVGRPARTGGVRDRRLPGFHAESYAGWGDFVFRGVGRDRGGLAGSSRARSFDHLSAGGGWMSGFFDPGGDGSVATVLIDVAPEQSSQEGTSPLRLASATNQRGHMCHLAVYARHILSSIA